MTRRLNVVAHTHWDREWYLPFEEFRDRLVTAMDLLLELMGDDRWTHFHLDGQTAMIADYLAVRPEKADELTAHIRSGRLSCGPWVTLVDEFLVSGESIVRNLADGLDHADALGNAMRVGYLPDQFGHIGQMPQILVAAGIEKAVVWRGVPGAITGSGFVWRAPDGSAVETLYLPFGYGHGRGLASDPAGFEARLAKEVSRLAPFLSPSEPVLVMCGGDHEPPEPNLPDLLANTRPEYEVRLVSLAGHLAGWKVPDAAWTGELRSAARANLLPNTYSVRPEQKIQRARAEHRLERYAEPLAALVPGEPWPADELRTAWNLLHLNGAHDSVCGCSTDAVAHAVDHRTARVATIANAITDRALDRLAAEMHEAGTLLFNPSPFERDGVPGLGWTVVRSSVPQPTPLGLTTDGDSIVVPVGDAELSLRLEDQTDGGDLYTFCPASEPSGPQSVDIGEGRVDFHFDRFDARVRIWPTPDPFTARVRVDIDNRSPDHRVRVVIDLPEAATTTRAGSPFEIVTRERVGEGGPSEPPAVDWPARGFVLSGNAGFLAEGVFEYELRDGTLAMTLMRCVGTISKESLPTRSLVAGPDVATPEAQLIGRHSFSFGVVTPDPGPAVITTWERFALPFSSVASPGIGRLARSGRLVDIDVPALSALRVVDGVSEARVWNPFSHPVEAHVASRRVTLGPHRIETVRLS